MDSPIHTWWHFMNKYYVFPIYTTNNTVINNFWDSKYNCYTNTESHIIKQPWSISMLQTYTHTNTHIIHSYILLNSWRTTRLPISIFIQNSDRELSNSHLCHTMSSWLWSKHKIRIFFLISNSRCIDPHSFYASSLVDHLAAAQHLSDPP